MPKRRAWFTLNDDGWPNSKWFPEWITTDPRVAQDMRESVGDENVVEATWEAPDADPR